MNELVLKMDSRANFSKGICIDGKSVNFKKNEFGSYEVKYTTEKKSVEVSIVKYLELSHKLWLLMSLIFFVISLFGLLDTPYDRKCIVIDCKFTVSLSEKTKVTLKFDQKAESGKAIEIVSENPVQEINNVCYVDKKAKTRWRILLGIKIALWLALIVGVVLFITKNV